jgi:Mg2+-importing ATPase
VPTTAFERGISSFGALLVRVMLALVLLIFALNAVAGRSFLDSLLFALAIGVGLTPQMLPAIVSISLALGAKQMAKQKVIVKRLSAIEDAGGMDILCTDKTGTLTAGVVTLSAALGTNGAHSDVVAREAQLNAQLHAGYANPIDEAIISSLGKATSGARRIGEIPYDFMRRRMSVLVEERGAMRLITKGAFKEVLEACTATLGAEADVVLTADTVAFLGSEQQRLSASGFRVLAIAAKPMESRVQLAPSDEAGMTFLGFLTFSDPPKLDARLAVEGLRDHGVSVRMITGDNRFAAMHVAQTAGLLEGDLLTGDEIERVGDSDLPAAVESVQVFAEINPIQKERIVRAFRHAGHTVGFLGDGIN